MKFCKHCGEQLKDDALFCPNCGARVEEKPDPEIFGQDAVQETAPEQEASGPAVIPVVAASAENEAPKSDYSAEEAPRYESPKYEAPKYDTPKAEPGMYKDTTGITERNIALCIVFSIITCGIYGLYWMYKLNDEINQISGAENATSGGMVILLSIVTCGIYGWYWCYKMGERVDKITNSDSNKILFIVLAIFQLGIVDYAIMQDTINKELV